MELEDGEINESVESNLNHGTHIFNNLLEEDSGGEPPSIPEANPSLKQEPQMPALGVQLTGNLEFNLRTIEVKAQFTKKEELNCFLPEKSYPQQPEEDPLEDIILQAKGLQTSTLSPRKLSHICKTAYLHETRADKIARYREKKLRRVWHRKISYNCRKVVADKRMRKHGRFVKKQESNVAASSAKSSWQTKEGQVKQECSVFKVQDYYL